MDSNRWLGTTVHELAFHVASYVRLSPSREHFLKDILVQLFGATRVCLFSKEGDTEIIHVH